MCILTKYISLESGRNGLQIYIVALTILETICNQLLAVVIKKFLIIMFKILNQRAMPVRRNCKKRT